jgi:hypothetical protein
LVPPSGFVYPHDGLRPSRPWPVLFRTGSALGINPSELPPSKRYSTRFRVEGPTYCFTCLYTLCRSIGPAGRPQFLGFGLFEVPGDPRVFSTSTAGCSLGLLPSRAPSRKPWPSLHPASSRVLSTSRSQRRHLRVSISLRSASLSVHINANNEVKPPLEAFYTNRFPYIQAASIRAMCSPRVGMHITVQLPALCG